MAGHHQKAVIMNNRVQLRQPSAESVWMSPLRGTHFTP